MKRIFTFFAMVSSLLSASAQIQKVSYRGAFAPAPTPMWTEGWAEWNPQNKVYGTPNVNVSGSITTNTTWTANNVYLLQGLVLVEDGATLTIEPGTVIRGDNATPNSALVVKRGGKLIAAGTPCNPIVFTSSKAVGQRAPGDWGGIILLGRGSVNSPGGVNYIEGLPANDNSIYGGGTTPDDNDNKGILSYIRIEFGGYVFEANREINGLTMGAIGRATQIDHIQCSFINDDSFEWFGGTVNATHLVAYRGVDDNWDTDFGWSGAVQFALGVRDPDLFDPTYNAASGASTSEGFESDNDANGSTNAPKTKGLFSNVTEIGPYRGSTGNSIGAGFRRSARIRRNSELKVFNSILMDYPTGVFIDGSAAQSNLTNGLLKFSNNIVAGNQTGRVMENGTPSNIRTFLFDAAGSSKNDSLVSTAGILTNPYQYSTPDYRPAIGSPALSNVNFTDPAFGGLLGSGDFFKQVPYRGAFAPLPTPMWTEGWAEWNPQDKAYGTPNVNVSASISTNTTWTANNVYLLQGLVYVEDGATLTIEAGTVIRGDNATPNSALVVKRGGRLVAVGSPCNPIVFTSSKAAGQRAPGDWGGIIMLGRGTVNSPGGVNYIEGLPANDNSIYGGGTTPDDNENKGILSYIRIEFGGYVFEANREINGLTLGAVGRNTQIDHIQCSFINDDSFEWFGGAVNATHLVAYRGVDDDFDTDFGWSGNVQFGLAVRDPDLFDPTYNAASGASTSEGFESDNDANGSTNAPKTSGAFSNMTIIGPYRGSASNPIGAGFRRGARIRRNSELKVFNSIFMDHPTGVFIDGSAAQTNLTNGLLRFRRNLIAGNQAGRVMETSTPSNIRTFLFDASGVSKNDSLVSTAGILIRPYEFLTPDYRPATNSPALTNYDYTDPVLPVSLLSFDGETNKGTHILHWATSTETNNRGFELQRSADGRNFITIAIVPSKAIGGNSVQPLAYSYTDANPFQGFSYYRLRQTDIDGRFTYSNVISLNLSQVNILSFGMIYPNPVRDNLGLIILSPDDRTMELVTSDGLGRIVGRRILNLRKGANNVQMNVTALQAGSYFLKLQSQSLGNESAMHKFIKL